MADSSLSFLPCGVSLGLIIAENPKLLARGAPSQLSVRPTLARTVLTPPGVWRYCNTPGFLPVALSLSAAPSQMLLIQGRASLSCPGEVAAFP